MTTFGQEDETKSNKRSHTEFAGQQEDGEQELLCMPDPRVLN
jgi:hypothetical protein